MTQKKDTREYFGNKECVIQHQNITLFHCTRILQVESMFLSVADG